jgi:hypothetical protein
VFPSLRMVAIFWYGSLCCVAYTLSLSLGPSIDVYSRGWWVYVYILLTICPCLCTLNPVEHGVVLCCLAWFGFCALLSSYTSVLVNYMFTLPRPTGWSVVCIV